MKAGNTGGYLLPYWKNICNDKKNNGKIQNFKKNQQKLILQREIAEQQARLLSEMLLCI